MVGKEISLGNLKKETKANRTTVKSRRKYTYQYFDENNDERKRISNSYFKDTLNIGGKQCHLRFKAEVMECDVWTKEKKKSGISEEDINVVRKNIEYFRTQFSLIILGKRQAKNI